MKDLYTKTSLPLCDPIQKGKTYMAMRDDKNMNELNELVFKWKKHVPEEGIGQPLSK